MICGAACYLNIIIFSIKIISSYSRKIYTFLIDNGLIQLLTGLCMIEWQRIGNSSTKGKYYIIQNIHFLYNNNEHSTHGCFRHIMYRLKFRTHDIIGNVIKKIYMYIILNNINDRSLVHQCDLTLKEEKEYRIYFLYMYMQ